MGGDMETLIRRRAFEWLEEQQLLYGDALPRNILLEGFYFEGKRVTLIGPSGIWIPRVFAKIPISITTTPDSPYKDTFISEDAFKYSYRGHDIYHRDNVGLREAMLHHTPLVYFHRTVPGRYMAGFPVYIIGDDPASLTFTAHVQENQLFQYAGTGAAAAPAALYVQDGDGQRAYRTATFRQRLHQQTFRQRVLRAYQSQCAFCRLKHEKLLDAAHIIQDTHELGEPYVVNGMALCKIHHAAFDVNIIGVTPDYIIKVREDILHEIDGPMLKHGIQAMQNTKIALPGHAHDWPDRERLDQRYKQFLSAG